jgi:hypothetical protein
MCSRCEDNLERDEQAAATATAAACCTYIQVVFYADKLNQSSGGDRPKLFQFFHRGCIHLLIAA